MRLEMDGNTSRTIGDVLTCICVIAFLLVLLRGCEMQNETAVKVQQIQQQAKETL